MRAVVSGVGKAQVRVLGSLEPEVPELPSCVTTRMHPEECNKWSSHLTSY